MGYIPEEIITQILDRADIVEIISDYVPLKKAGRNFKGLSPFTNEKTPSFIVSPDKQIFHCFSSGKGGNVLSFIMLQERMSFPEAARFLANKLGISIPEASPQEKRNQSLHQAIIDVNIQAVQYYHEVLLTSQDPDVREAREYLKQRGVTLEAVKTFQLGFALDQWQGLFDHLKHKDISIQLMHKAGLIMPRQNGEGYFDRFRGRIVFPIFDYQKKAIAFGARTLKQDEAAKYINSADTPVYTKGKHLYGFSLSKEAVGKQDRIVIVEGYMDFIMPYFNGFHAIAASLGTALTDDQIRLIRRYTKNVVMLFDTDKAGLAAIMRSCEPLLKQGMNARVATLGEGQDPDSFIRQHGLEAFSKRIDEAVSFFDFQWDMISQQYDVKTVEDRAKICEEIFPLIGLYQNEVTKAGYVQELAHRLGVNEQVIAQEFAKIKQTPQRANPAQEQPKQGVAQHKNISAPEKLLLTLVLSDLDLLDSVIQALSLDDIQHEGVRDILHTIIQYRQEHERMELAQVMSLFEQGPWQELLSKLLMEDQAIIDQKRSLEDCIKRIKSKKLDEEKQALKTKIRQAETQGDDKQIEELQIQFHNLIRGNHNA